MKHNPTDIVWKDRVEYIYYNPEYISRPREMTINEQIAGQYTVPMPAYLTLTKRRVNYSFMFAEAAWIVEGSNRLDRIKPYMKFYANFSDDGEFMRGAYGPKISDQMGYIVDTLENDKDSRQAYLNIWRERPGQSKDIPCTTGMQFVIRDDILHLIVTMRSNDIVKGFTYDVFTFSMVALAIQISLRKRGIQTSLGNLTVNAGSLHLYESDFSSVDNWISSTDTTSAVDEYVEELLNCESQTELINMLWSFANKWKYIKEKQ